MRWLVAEDFAVPLHTSVWQCLTALTHRGDPVDPVTVLWEAQRRGLLAHDVTPASLLARSHAVATRITAYTGDPTNSPHQLITGSRRALADLTALRTRWQHTSGPATPASSRTARTPSAPRAGPPPRVTAPTARAAR